MKSKVVLLIISVILLALAALCYSLLFKSNIESEENTYLFIHTEDSFEQVLSNLESTGTLKSSTGFSLVASLLSYPDHIIAGRYELTNGMTNLQLVRKLRNGSQSPVRVTFNNIRTEDKLAEKITENLEMSADELIAELHGQETLEKYGMTKENIISLFRPNTYEFYWNVTPTKLVEKMGKEYQKLWNDDRLDKLKEIGLSKEEVITLASIVEEETIKEDEKPMVAGLYINRLKINMMLQADPTIKFALQDFSIKRIYNYHIEMGANSPYNTYKKTGLPPGPIRIPTTGSIDAVLNYAHHSYIYMCAKEDFSGYHNFAEDYNTHLRNAARYQKELENRNIR